MHELQALLYEYDRARTYTDELWKDHTPDEVTWRPHENSSAIGWHLGHQAHVAHFMIRNLTAAEPRPGSGRPDGLRAARTVPRRPAHGATALRLPRHRRRARPCTHRRHRRRQRQRPHPADHRRDLLADRAYQ